MGISENINRAVQNYAGGKIGEKIDTAIRSRPSSPSALDRLRGGAEKVIGWAQNHPMNQEPKERRERKSRHERRESRAQERSEHRRGNGRVSRVDRYQDGKVAETIYFSTNESIPRAKKPKKQKSPRVSGGIGMGMNMQDFIPPGMGMSTMGPFEQMSYGQKKRKRSDMDWADPGYIPPSLRDFF